jgi:hypothetical protein
VMRNSTELHQDEQNQPLISRSLDSTHARTAVLPCS